MKKKYNTMPESMKNMEMYDLIGWSCSLCSFPTLHNDII